MALYAVFENTEVTIRFEKGEEGAKFGSGKDSIEITFKRPYEGKKIDLTKFSEYEDIVAPDSFIFIGWKNTTNAEYNIALDEETGARVVDAYNFYANQTYVPILEEVEEEEIVLGDGDVVISYLVPSNSFDKVTAYKEVVKEGTRFADTEVFKKNFDKIDGYNFAGWYEITDKDYEADGLEEFYNDPMNFSKVFLRQLGIEDGIDTWFRFFQNPTLPFDTENDSLFGLKANIANSAERLDKKDQIFENVLLMPMFTTTITLNAGENGMFSNGKNIMYIEGVLPRLYNLNRIEKDNSSYEEPTANDDLLFAYWSTEDGEDFSKETYIDKNISLYANYVNEEKVTVTFNLGESEKWDTDLEVVDGKVQVQVLKGTNFNEIKTPKVYREGHNFGGWYLNGEKITTTGEKAYVVKEDIEVVAGFDKNTYYYNFVYIDPVSNEKIELGVIGGKFGEVLKDIKPIYKEFPNGESIKMTNGFEKVEYLFEKNAVLGDNLLIKEFRKDTIDGEIITKDSVIEPQGNKLMIDIYVIFEDVVFTIEFDDTLDDETNENQKVLVAFGKKFKDIKAPKAVSNDGLKFVHWADSKGERVTKDYVFTKDDVFTPVWTDKVISLTFAAGDGSFGDADDGIVEVVFDDVPKGIVLEEIEGYVEPEQKGKSFDYWEVEYLEEEIVEDNEEDIDEDDNDYEENDGFEKTESDLVGNTVESAGASGSSNSASGGSGNDNRLLRTHTIEKSAVLKAVYREVTVQLKVDLNLGYEFKRTLVYNNGKSTSYQTNSGSIIYEDVPKDSTFIDFLNTWEIKNELPGKEFKGWMKKVGNGWKEFTEEEQNAPLTEDTYIMASFETLKWTFVVDANGGKYSDGSTKKTYANVISGTLVNRIPGFENPTRNGYSIAGYSKNSSASNKGVGLNETIVSNNTIYVIWVANSVAPVAPSSSSTRRSSGGGGSSSSSSGGGGSIVNAASGGGQVTPTANTPDATNTQETAQVVKTSDSMNDLFANTTGASEMSKILETKSNQSLTESSLNEVNTYMNTLLFASGLQNTQVMTNQEVVSKTNEVAKGKDYQKQLEAIFTEAQQNPEKTNQKAAVSTQNINIANANWSYDSNGNIKLTDKSTNQVVANKWQAVGDDNGNKTWYKFDESGNMQTGLVVDGGHTYYLKDTNDENRGKMAVNETVTIGGLMLTFNQDGALTGMNYDETVAINQLSSAIINAVSNPVL